MDIANSVTSAGKIREAFKQGNEIPKGWALNGRGEETTDPVEALHGILLPFGEHKGYGITFAVSILSALLSNGIFDADVKPVDDQDHHQQVSHLFIAINIDFFQSVQTFKERMKEVVLNLHRSELVPHNSNIYYPGERGYTQKEELLYLGKVTINKTVWTDIRNIFSNPFI
jgi:LDH2 family malate/lactate/ureidoglycolate dehydrogenase